ncbi:RelA/SpoT domain-containing protein [Herminiimonas fonticola]|uniref:RelA/SpoT family protein n=1 Tax=Herminiimonas fonticola TaxID=303380 RepID=A0A4V3BUZ8_9BURK|nr:RelA/SpoT domain-containing protein [Herminiimonas fonticola]RBA23279.1 RelA / SpoT protein [Herminiimonas fonticola]TDN88998.1 RelA/SpoT family protein [Herminiimonas fonticola]
MKKAAEKIIEKSSSIYSKTAVGRAGETLKKTSISIDNPDAHLEALKALSYWRACHITPLDHAVSELAVVTQKDKAAIIAKRLKRTPSIIAKLNRESGMLLQNMQDVGGCRVVLRSLRHVNKVRRALKTRGIYRERDYIQTPKKDGYRGVHMIGKFPGEQGNTAFVIEIQLRTEVQHAWATAVEIIDLFTKQALKNDDGRPDWLNFFSAAGEAFSELDGVVINDESHMESCAEVARLARKLAVLDKFEAYNTSLRILDEEGIKWVEGYYLISIDTREKTLRYDFFGIPEYTNALDEYLQKERSSANNPEVIVALVSTHSLSSLKEAYPNYFADAHKFVQHLNTIIARHEYANPNWIKRILLGLSSDKRPRIPE